MEAKDQIERIIMPNVRVDSVTDSIGWGLGPIAPAQVLTAEQIQSHAKDLVGLLTEANPRVPGGCIDGRGALRMLNDADVETGLKSAGGNGISAFYALEVSGFFDKSSSIFQNFVHVVVTLENAGHPVGFHTRDKKAKGLHDLILEQREAFAGKSIDEVVAAMDNMTAEQSGTACAASDEMEPINGKLSRNPQTYQDGRLETTDEVAARIEHTFAITEEQSNEPVLRGTLEALVDRATQMDNEGRLKPWHSVKSLLLADQILLARGVNDGVLGRIQVLGDDGKGLHGHNENNVVVIKPHGVTLESSAIYAATGLKDFIVNGDEVGQQASNAFGHPAAKIGVLMFQVGTKTQVTNGQQGCIMLSA